MSWKTYWRELEYTLRSVSNLYLKEFGNMNVTDDRKTVSKSSWMNYASI